jgi:hypothetical protein
MSFEFSQESFEPDVKKGRESREDLDGKILELIAPFIKEGAISSENIRQISMPVPGSGLRIVEIDLKNDKDYLYFKVDPDSGETVEWLPAAQSMPEAEFEDLGEGR